MQVAQKLYEAGLITYMRTDSVNMSDFAMKEAETAITNKYGKEYSKPTTYVTKSKWSQEAHECIRPTHMENPSAGGDASEKRLYELIRKRSVASQMAHAEVEKTKATIEISTNPLKFIATGEVVKFDGFLKVYFEWNDEDEEGGEDTTMLPVLKTGEVVNANQIAATQRFKNHPPRYTEASLVKKMEELGIGRPSTYAPTISTIQKRGYVVKEDRLWDVRNYIEMILKDAEIKVETKQQNTWAEKQKLFPTDTGMVVTDFLIANFKDIMDYNFTANVEEEFDNIAEGKIKRSKMIEQFYWPFHAEVAKTLEFAERESGERELGIDPNSGKRVIARIGRFGAMVQIGQTTETEKPKYASIPAGKNIETITLQEALDAFSLPRTLGEYKWETVTAAIGRFGPYVKYKTTFVSIPKASELDPFKITLEEAIPLIENKLTADANKNISTFDHEGWQIFVLNGMYGPYIKYGKMNYKIPKGGKDASDLKLEDCLTIINTSKKFPTTKPVIASEAKQSSLSSWAKSKDITVKPTKKPAKPATADKVAKPKKLATKKAKK